MACCVSSKNAVAVHLCWKRKSRLSDSGRGWLFKDQRDFYVNQYSECPLS